MRHLILAAALAEAALCPLPAARAQSGDLSPRMVVPGLTALDTPADPRLVALGESGVALRGSSGALMSNPAGLAGVDGLGASYAWRSYDWTGLQSSGYTDVTAVMGTSLGTVAIAYDRFSLGKIPITDEGHPSGTGRFLEPHDELFSLGVAHQFGEHWSAGLGVKAYNQMILTGSSTAARPWLFDFGLQFTTPFPSSSPGPPGRFTAGIAAQNMGTDYRVAVPYPYGPVFGQTTREYLQPIPRYLRVGFAFEHGISARSREALAPLTVLLSAEYRYLANAEQFRNPGTLAPTTDQRDYWGLGLEAQLFEIVSLRAGGFAQPGTSPLYSEAGTLRVRYGGGLRVPLGRFGLPVPLVVRGDYAAIPISRAESDALGRVQQISSTLHAFSASLQLEGRVF